MSASPFILPDDSGKKAAPAPVVTGYVLPDEPEDRRAAKLPRIGELTDRQRAAVEIKLAEPGIKHSELAERAGFASVQSLRKSMATPQVRNYLSAALDAAGARIEDSAKVIAEAHAATKVTHFSFQGNVTDEREDIDHRMRLDAAELNLEARGELHKNAAIAQQNNMYVNLTDQQLAAIASGAAKAADFMGHGHR